MEIASLVRTAHLDTKKVINMQPPFGWPDGIYDGIYYTHWGRIASMPNIGDHNTSYLALVIARGARDDKSVTEHYLLEYKVRLFHHWEMFEEGDPVFFVVPKDAFIYIARPRLNKVDKLFTFATDMKGFRYVIPKTDASS